MKPFLKQLEYSLSSIIYQYCEYTSNSMTVSNSSHCRVLYLLDTVLRWNNHNSFIVSNTNKRLVMIMIFDRYEWLHNRSKLALEDPKYCDDIFITVTDDMLHN